MPKLGKQQQRVVNGREFTAVGAYIFAGGFTLGAQKHFHVFCHLEETNYGVATAQANFPGLSIYVGLDNWPLQELKNKVDFAYGNPPCAAWSNNGSNGHAGVDRWRTDPRVDCTRRHFSLLAELRPKIWAWESVTQAFLRGRPFVDDLARRAAAIGYATTHILHDAKWLGLPQCRPRYFMVCHRIAFAPNEPDWRGPLTSRAALAQIAGQVRGQEEVWCRPLHERQFRGRLHEVLPGERLSKSWERLLRPARIERNKAGGIKGRPANSNYRLHPDRPATVMTGNFLVIHPTEDRPLFFEEQKHLSGFPLDYQFIPKGLCARQCELARGVCPPVGEWLAAAAAQAIHANRPLSKISSILIDYRKPGIRPADLTAEILAGRKVIVRCRS